jgi:hypothetical protein
VTFDDFEEPDDIFSGLTTGTLEDLLDEIEAHWAEFGAAVSSFTDEEILRPQSIGDWSLKDLIAHVAAWEEEAARRIDEIIRGNGASLTWPTKEEEDAFNEAAVSASQGLSIDQVIKRLEDCHQDVIDMLASFGDELATADIEVPAGEWVPGWTYLHYQNHLPDIWRLKDS